MSSYQFQTSYNTGGQLSVSEIGARQTQSVFPLATSTFPSQTGGQVHTNANLINEVQGRYQIDQDQERISQNQSSQKKLPQFVSFNGTDINKVDENKFFTSSHLPRNYNSSMNALNVRDSVLNNQVLAQQQQSALNSSISRGRINDDILLSKRQTEYVKASSAFQSHEKDYEEELKNRAKKDINFSTRYQNLDYKIGENQKLFNIDNSYRNLNNSYQAKQDLERLKSLDNETRDRHIRDSTLNMKLSALKQSKQVFIQDDLSKSSYRRDNLNNSSYLKDDIIQLDQLANLQNSQYQPSLQQISQPSNLIYNNDLAISQAMQRYQERQLQEQQQQLDYEKLKRSSYMEQVKRSYNARSSTQSTQVQYFAPHPQYEPKLFIEQIQQNQLVQGYASKNFGSFEIIRQCEIRNQRFKDLEFLPSRELIGGSLAQNLVNFTWNRLSFQPFAKVFTQGIVPTDIVQGELGDSYFIASLATLSEWSYMINQLFLTKEITSVGCYAVKFVWKGTWREIIIDDYFPCRNNQPIFSKSLDNELWVLILEKAWAKLHGNYCQIDGGLAREALHDLTGAPSKTYFIQNEQGEMSQENQQIWQLIKSGESKNHAMLCGSNDNVNTGEFDYQYGLAKSFMYTLLSVVQIDLEQGTIIQLVKLRNPWKDVAWKGRFCDSDIIWQKINENVRNKIGFQKDNKDGIFFMLFEDFIKHFSDITISYIQKNYIYHGIPFMANQQRIQKFFSIQIKTEGYYQFQVSQQTIRLSSFDLQDSLSPPNLYYSHISLLIAFHTVIQHQQYINTQTLALMVPIKVSGKERDLTSWKYIENPFLWKPGQYFAQIIVNPSQYYQTDNYGFGCYGSSKVEIQEISRNQCQQFANYADNNLVYNERI